MFVTLGGRGCPGDGGEAGLMGEETTSEWPEGRKRGATDKYQYLQTHEDCPDNFETRLEIPGAFHEDGALPREPYVPRILRNGQEQH